MSTHIRHTEQEKFYFITFTCYKWLNLFEDADIYEYLPFWFSKFHEQGCFLNGYVVMPNHLHMVIYFKHSTKTVNQVMAESKRFLAYEIVKRLKRLDKEVLLQQMQDGVQSNERAKGKKHQVFRLSFDAKELTSYEDVESVLDYIHRNPVSGKWNLADDFVNYPYSSASFYEEGVERFVPVVDYREVPSESSSSDSE